MGVMIGSGRLKCEIYISALCKEIRCSIRDESVCLSWEDPGRVSIEVLVKFDCGNQNV